jgi:hypothetical protein
MLSKSKPKKSRLFWIGIFSAIFGVVFFVLLLNSMGGVKNSSTEHANYEAYLQKHNCNREIIEHNRVWGENRYLPYQRCDNGLWTEEAVIEVANHRVPRSK